MIIIKLSNDKNLKYDKNIKKFINITSYFRFSDSRDASKGKF